jgi:hypothetical protein
MEPVIESALQSPDGYWRVEVVRYAPGRRWYRILHATTVVADQASLATVERVLGEAFATLEPLDAA